MTDYSRSLALLMADALAFTDRPLNDDQLDDVREAFELLERGVTEETERAMFRRLLDHGWITTAPFNPELVNHWSFGNSDSKPSCVFPTREAYERMRKTE